jgi:hypothetical protein
MLTINRILEDKITEVEDHYLSDSDLSQLVKYAGVFSTRLQTYNLIRDRADEIVEKSLQILVQAYPALMQKHTDRCKYDMSHILRYMSLAILRDDELFFREQMMDWHSTVLFAYQVTTECSMAYRKMQEVIDKILPPECSILVKTYTDMAVRLLSKN